MASQEDLPTKAVRNQSLFRDINERIAEFNADIVPRTETEWEFLCECADTDCKSTISLTRAEYEAVRLVPTHFPILPGHQVPEVERVVEKTKRFYIVEKFGTAGLHAVERDPRREPA